MGNLEWSSFRIIPEDLEFHAGLTATSFTATGFADENGALVPTPSSRAVCTAPLSVSGAKDPKGRQKGRDGVGLPEKQVFELSSDIISVDCKFAKMFTI